MNTDGHGFKLIPSRDTNFTNEHESKACLVPPKSDEGGSTFPKIPFSAIERPQTYFFIGLCLKSGMGEWLCVGRFHLVRASTDPNAITKYSGSARRSDVYKILFLEEVAK